MISQYVNKKTLMMTIKHLRVRRNEVFVTNSDFLIPISSQLNVVDHRSNNLSLKYQRFTLLKE